MLLSTTHAIDGRTVVAYRGIVAAEVVMGANFVRDLMAQFTDAAGGRSKTYEREFENARAAAIAQMEVKARALGADAVVGIRVGYQVLGEANGMMMVAAHGTAVQLARSEAEQARDAAQAQADQPVHYVSLNGTERGPFSTNQIRELVRTGKLSEEVSVRTDGRTELVPVAAIIGA